MRRPRRAAVGVLSPGRALKLGKIRRHACFRLIPFLGTGNVLLAPTMISHPLAYVAPNPRHESSTTWFKQGRKGVGVGEDLLPESRTWSKEEIMGAKSSRDWLSNWSLGLIGK